jgi:superfamily II DNA or RNA helicase
MQASLRPYQKECVAHLLAHQRAMVVAPAGAGKTVIGAHALARLGPGVPFAWLANTREQVEQAEGALRTAGVDLSAGLVCCVMSRPRLENYNCVIVDESHHAPASVWHATINTMRPEARLWGLTATPFGDDEERNDSIKQMFQEFIFIDRDDVMAGGHLVPGAVVPHDLDSHGQYDPEIRPRVDLETRNRARRWPTVPEHEHRSRVVWQLTQEHLRQNEIRNSRIAKIASDAMAAGETVIVLVGSIEHGEKLVSLIPGSAIVHSKLSSKERARRTDALRNGALGCAVATSLMDEGADFPRASSLILAAGGRSPTKVIQRTGRVMRPSQGKTHGTVHDFVDRGLLFAHAQWKSRVRTYQQLNYEIHEPVK